MRIITVRELTAHVKGIFENDTLLVNLWVKGEISNYRRTSSGHVYFTLKDSVSCIRAVMFRSRADRLRFIPENGMAVRIRGFVSVYEKDGSYQLYAEEIEPDGIGAMYVAFEQLKERLQREGLFNRERKKEILPFPGTIGIVTSPTGAAIRDMVEIIGRRWPGIRIILAPVSVQGNSAPGEIARGIEILNGLGGVDVIIIGRGGGSLEELWAFNTEEVAYAIHKSSLPVISAVGHESDYTIADMVADLRAPTPSAAAELVVPVKAEVAYTIDILKARMIRALGEKIGFSRHRLDSCWQSPAFRRSVDTVCGPWVLTVDTLSRKLCKSVQEVVAAQRTKVSVLTGRLDVLSPLATMARGFSVCTLEKSGEVIRNTFNVKPGDQVKLKLYKGCLRCKVDEIIEQKK